jgi:outer membrane lipoprotein-sorting protein
MTLDARPRRAARAAAAAALAGAVAAAIAASAGAPLWAAPSAAAERRAQEELLGRLSARYKGLKSFKASYRRSTSTPATDPVFKSQAVQTAEGVLYWRKPHSLRLVQERPAPEELVTDGATAWWYVPSEKTVHVYEGESLAEGFRPLAAFFDGADELKRHYRITSAPPDPSRPGASGFVLNPKGGADAGASVITVWCGQDTVLEGFRLSSGTGEKTDFYLESPEADPALPGDFFVFRAPRGVRVVREAEGE